jgi:KUP system potassium uptake protein
LYALQTVFTANNHAIPLTTEAVDGVISMVFWAITMVVSVKYVTFVMRADNNGEGGIMALVALIKRVVDGKSAKRMAVLVALGVFGAALFFGDAMITPAISVLSAVEGLQTVSPGLASLVIPITIAVLVLLFSMQRFGTGVVGKLFGPVCALWFVVIALAGFNQILHHPSIIAALSPSYAVAFALSHPGLAFLGLAGVVLTITGVEALYADMGHFGRPAISRAWFFVVFPALTLNYMGQGALILHHPHTVNNLFFALFPAWSQLPVVLLATAATVIASQAVISGAFSLARQASQLGFLPRLVIRHTSTATEGQVYAPAINRLIFVAVVILVLGFRTSAALAIAYGVAVTGTITITTILFLVVARARWHTPKYIIAVGGTVFLGIDLTFFSANLPKLLTGGWFPVGIALAVFVIFKTWDKGRAIVSVARIAKEGPLREFIESVHEMSPPLHRVPGTAVFLNANAETTPLALRANTEHNHTLHESIIILTVKVLTVPSVPETERVSEDDLGYGDDGIFHLCVSYGFNDRTDVPAAIALACEQGLVERELDLVDASYFVSRIVLRQGGRNFHHMARWRKMLFLGLAHYAADPVEYFSLPVDRTVVMGGQITV